MNLNSSFRVENLALTFGRLILWWIRCVRSKYQLYKTFVDLQLVFLRSVKFNLWNTIKYFPFKNTLLVNNNISWCLISRQVSGYLDFPKESLEESSFSKENPWRFELFLYYGWLAGLIVCSLSANRYQGVPFVHPINTLYLIIIL